MTKKVAVNSKTEFQRNSCLKPKVTS